jgi:hypothetical protein
MALKHYQRLAELKIADRSVIIHDRGYISLEQAWELDQLGIHYMFRVKSKFNKEIDRLPEGFDTIVEIKGKGENKGRNVTLRVAKFKLDSGEVETLAMDAGLTAEMLPFEELKKVYFYRWKIILICR